MKKILSSLIMFSMIFSFIGTVSFNFGEKKALASTPAIVDLGGAGNYAVLAKTAITTTGTSAISGDVGINPALSSDTSGFALVLDASGTFATSSQVTGKVYAANYTAPTPSTLSTAVSDMEAAYTNANGRATTVLNVGAGNLASLNLVAGVYTFDGSGDVSISNDVTLTGDANDVWIFQIPGNLDISAGKNVILAGGAVSSNIFWAVAGTTTLHANSTFIGNILAGPGASTIAMENGATLNGRALGQTDVTLIANIVSDKLVTSEPPATTVTIVKYLNDQPATADSANNTAFSMHAIYPGGEGDYDLAPVGFNNPSPYYATTGEMPLGSNYSTYENMNTVVGASCNADAVTPYALTGYSTGNDLNDALNGTVTTEVPAFTNLTQNKFVVVWNESCAPIVVPPICEADGTAQSYFSDTTTLNDGNPTVVVSQPAGEWTTIPGATWIWTTDPVTSYVTGETQVLTKTFAVTETPTDATLEIAADNNYSVSLNGAPAFCTHPGGDGFLATQSCNIPAGELLANNTLTFTVTNNPEPSLTPSSDPHRNPAGLLYKLSFTENNICVPPVADVTVTVIKYINDDGMNHATAGNTTSASFPMTSTWNATNIGAGSGDFALGPVGFNNANAYEATTADMTSGADYSVVENLGTQCSAENQDQYVLDGYKLGDSEALALASGTVATASFANITNNKFIIVTNHKCPPVIVTPPMCDAVVGSQIIYSDVNTQVGGNNSVLVTTPINPGWTASIPGASWIWNEDPIVDTTVDDTQTFTRTFTITGTPTDSELIVAADNYYTVKVNGVSLFDGMSANNYTLETQDTYTIPAGALNTGLNTIEFTATNAGVPESTFLGNPAGLMYKLTVNNNTCINPTPNVAPVANANIDQSITLPTNSVTLDGTLSTDSDGTISSYMWNFVSGPSTIDPADTVSPNITGLVEGTYVFELKVTDNDGAMDTDTVSVVVNPTAVQNTSSNIRRSSSSGSRRSTPFNGIGGEGEVLGAATDLCTWDASYMRKGWFGNNVNDVTTVQNFLNQYMLSGLVVNGVFDSNMEAAVKAFQSKYASDILNPWGITSPTGLFYISTLNKAKELTCGKVPLPALINWSQNPAVR